MAFNFYTDSALTQPQVGNLIATQRSDGSTGPVKFQLWLGDDDPAFKYQADSDPGVDNVVVSVLDAVPGSGNPDTDVKLAVTEAGLVGATPGAALDLGTTEIVGGSVNAKQVWIQVEDSTGTVGTSTELSVQTNDLRKLDV